MRNINNDFTVMTIRYIIAMGLKPIAIENSYVAFLFGDKSNGTTILKLIFLPILNIPG